jgi:hypothetical protein
MSKLGRVRLNTLYTNEWTWGDLYAALFLCTRKRADSAIETLDIDQYLMLLRNEYIRQGCPANGKSKEPLECSVCVSVRNTQSATDLIKCKQTCIFSSALFLLYYIGPVAHSDVLVVPSSVRLYTSLCAVTGGDCCSGASPVQALAASLLCPPGR